MPSDNNQTQQRDNNNNVRKEQTNNNRQDIEEPEGLSEQNLPESDNKSTGGMGSGQRQDSNWLLLSIFFYKPVLKQICSKSVLRPDVRA